MRTFLFLLVYFTAPILSQPLTNDRCDDDNENLACCFLNMPKQLSHIVSIANTTEPGERLRITGRVTKRDGSTPYPGVALYAYHTNNQGIYPKKGNEVGIHKWHGYLHGWGKTNERGEYEIHSIRPAMYPSNNSPAHIHLVIKEPDGKMTYVNDFVFKDDPLVTTSYLSRLYYRGDNGAVDVKKNAEGVWVGVRNIPIR
ncbi:MAG: dioxygenase family protein [Bacteroidota bacterium]